MAGISLNDSPSMKLKKTQLGSQMFPSLGGSAISIDREQRDAMFYRLLCSTDTKSKLKECRKKTTSTVDNRIPVAKASSTITEVIASIRKLETAKDKIPIQSTPKKQTSTIKSREKASTPMSSLLTAKSPAATKQLSRCSYCGSRLFYYRIDLCLFSRFTWKATESRDIKAPCLRGIRLVIVISVFSLLSVFLAIFSFCSTSGCIGQWKLLLESLFFQFCLDSR